MNEADLRTLIVALRNGDESVKIGGEIKITMQAAADVIEQSMSTAAVKLVHTLPCSVCRGEHPEYSNRPWSKGCPSLIQRTHPKPFVPKRKPPKGINRAELAVKMRADGATHSEIAEALGVSRYTVDGYLTAANKAAGTTKVHHKRVMADGK